MKILKSLLLLTLFFSTLSQGATLAGRHVYIIHPGMDSVWGSYMLVVEREAEEGATESAQFQLMLPTETEDWSPQQGIEKDSVQLKPDGGLLVDAVFEKPQTLVVTGFKVAGNSGRVPFTIKVPFEMEDFAVMAIEGQIKIVSDDMKYVGAKDFSGRKYDTWSMENVAQGKVIQFTVEGIPEGRRNYYILAGLFGLILIGGVTVLALRSKPKDSKHGEFELADV